MSATLCSSSPFVTSASNNVGFAGNLGTPYGCNLGLVDVSAKEQYPYKVTFSNVSRRDRLQKCVCWLKIGPSGQLDGSFKGNEVLQFDLTTGQDVIVAADAGSIGACSCHPTGVPLTPYGQFASTWLEFEMRSWNNDSRWSGADASSLVAAKYGMDVPGLRVCHDGAECSTINPGGSGTNAYLPGMEYQEGIGINLGPQPVSLRAMIGFGQ